jgi:ferrous iron transport protein B
MVSNELGYKSPEVFLKAKFTLQSMLAFIAFFIFYVPCLATISVIKQETNSWKIVFLQILGSLLVAYTMAILVFHFSKIVI